MPPKRRGKTRKPEETIERPEETETSETQKDISNHDEDEFSDKKDESEKSVPTDLKVSTPLKTMSHSEIQATNPLKLTVIEPGQTGNAANGLFIERLRSDDTDDVK
ncbi:hypothetical protein ADUPG1_003478, partial [Aduncisulcus paluster]